LKERDGYGEDKVLRQLSVQSSGSGAGKLYQGRAVVQSMASIGKQLAMALVADGARYDGGCKDDIKL
jgi:hypothetical protein